MKEVVEKWGEVVCGRKVIGALTMVKLLGFRKGFSLAPFFVFAFKPPSSSSFYKHEEVIRNESSEEGEGRFSKGVVMTPDKVIMSENKNKWFHPPNPNHYSPSQTHSPFRKRVRLATWWREGEGGVGNFSRLKLAKKVLLSLTAILFPFRFLPMKKGGVKPSTKRFIAAFSSQFSSKWLLPWDSKNHLLFGLGLYQFFWQPQKERIFLIEFIQRVIRKCTVQKYAWEIVCWSL